jgi:hypothetical protein
MQLQNMHIGQHLLGCWIAAIKETFVIMCPTNGGKFNLKQNINNHQWSFCMPILISSKAQYDTHP